ncbi:TetR family transcriptional regulator [Bacillus cereus]|uniref:TetR/AcrR family transcriptional regulator n=1 Tax=Bacillus cereus TaxID=1396 RepID=UPI000BEE4D24|nr:TetR/AcrR family transcriptional regulator [Bacillus cereus]PEC50668.1 TetR family transcriptional regulator [Bacillus cereus]PFE49756.1 TetR family transcriptional regulator [Bacillus cereus]PFN15968.1 TetR family transcriptional regulator [Bacillus cereus]PFS73467.1 TetR family transcriptional regulator [Bacillus cereus]PGS33470.1 TetR family transcriptional regulator [Bacillus cereus]
MEKQETKLKILAVASRLFQKQGYHATGINQIIKESGCPKGSIYHYFPEGKEQLAIEAINRTKDLATEQLRFLFSQHDDVIKALDDFLNQFLKFDPKATNDGTPLALISLETSQMSERLRLACRDAYEALVFVLKEKFIESNWSHTAAKENAYLFFSMIEGASIYALTYQSKEPMKIISKATMEIIRGRSK